MKSLLCLLVLVCCVYSTLGQETNPTQETKVTALLGELNLEDPKTQVDFFKFVEPDSLSATIQCLANDGEGCDPRTGPVRAIIQELSKTDYTCGECPLPTQRTINILLRAIKRAATPEQCSTLETSLQLSAKLCP